MRQTGWTGWLKNDLTTRGVTAYALSGVLTAFYVVLYFTSWLNPAAAWLVEAMHLQNAVAALFGTGPAGRVSSLHSKWFLYGVLYTIAIVGGGIFVLKRYWHNHYQVVRTSVVMFVQVVFAFSIPYILKLFDKPEFYFSYLWPLEITYFYPSNLSGMPTLFVLWSLVGSIVLVPLLGVFFGKRWYCSWVCGCGGLANTAGEPFRHLNSPRTEAWKFEKVAVHATLVVALLVTALVAASYVVEGSGSALGTYASQAQSWYGLIVAAMLQGVIGVGLYPVGGTRIWCRYFCPMAALLGLVQKFGRFKITVKDNMCISCGLCTKYCEMGIDVRAYAQGNEDFTRAACVGCGLCEEVCPRGVLHLENEWEEDPQELTMDMMIGKAERGL